MRQGEDGFTLVELLIAAAIALAASAAIFAIVKPTRAMLTANSEMADMQQRMRVAVDTLFADLLMAGAGPYTGGGIGPLNQWFAPVLPYRQSVANGDPPGSFRNDAITIMYVPSTHAQASIQNELLAQSGIALINPDPGCPQADPGCGFLKGMTVLVFDRTGAVDRYTVQDVQGPALALQHTMEDGAKAYAAGSKIVHAIVHSYFLKADSSSDTYQLMRDDGDGGLVVPVVDHVVAMEFEYWGTPGLGSGDGALDMLSEFELRDGPWRPDPASPSRHDVDLTRVRTIGVTVRIESALKAFRGPASALFARRGTAASADSFVPDQEVRFRVSPRNLGLR